MRIANIVPRAEYRIYVVAEDGRTGLFDVYPYLEAEAFAPLKKPGEFERLHNGGYFVEWDCGADLSADTIAAHWEVLTPAAGQAADPASQPPLDPAS